MSQSSSYSQLAGSGCALPRRCVSNQDMAGLVDTSDEWIVARTGIRQRFFADKQLGETTVSLAAQASRAALDDSGVAAGEVDLVILSTSTPDHSFPAGAVEVQGLLGIAHGSGFDMQTACCGFLYAMIVADGMLRSGQSGCALVIGSETMSRIIDMEDRSTCVLFGDGAGAVILRAAHADAAAAKGEQRGVLGSAWASLPQLKRILYVDGGVSTTGTAGHIKMEGQAVFRTVLDSGPPVISQALSNAGVGIDEVDWFVPHQANQRILSKVSDKIGLSQSKLISTVDQHANTSTASIPLALHQARVDGRIKQGDLVLMAAFGGGMTVGACVIRV